MKLGAEPKKIAILGGLLCVALFFFWKNVISTDSGSYSPPPAARLTPPPKPVPAARPATRTAARPPTTSRSGNRGVREFRPSLKPKREEDRPDPMTIDPTLRLDVLAKLQGIELDGVKRSLFDFSKPPAPKLPEPKILPEELAAIRKKQQEAAAKLAKKTTSKPPPPPINLKFYGFISGAETARKRAFFLDGEDIFVAAEGEIIKKGRYKIVKIGVNSAVVEDTQHDHQQTLKLEEVRG
jgi:hypothetical protein